MWLLPEPVDSCRLLDSPITAAKEHADEVNPQNDYLSHYLKSLQIISFPEEARTLEDLSPDYLVLNGNLHMERDIPSFFTSLRGRLKPAARLIATMKQKGGHQFYFNACTILDGRGHHKCCLVHKE